MTSPLRTDNDPSAPEALAIAGLINSGFFTPAVYGVGEGDLMCWKKLWRWCLDYQERELHAPSLELVMEHHPYYEHSHTATAAWACGLLKKVSESRRVRTSLMEAMQHFSDGENDKGYEIVDTIRRQVTGGKPVSIWDDHPDEDPDAIRIPVPYTSLGRSTGGIGAGEFWAISGRPGIGKTWTLVTYVAAAMAAGHSVAYLSLEMPAKVIAGRVLRVLAGADKDLHALLSGTPAEWRRARDEIRLDCPGQLSVLDPSHGRANNASVRAQQVDHDLVIVDHVGLMYSAGGVRAVSDWRVLAEISNTLKEDALAYRTPILVAVQLNRAAESASEKPASVDKLGGSDALGQDADVVITMKRLSTSVMTHSAEKVREGPSVLWHSRYQPGTGNFVEITREKAYEHQANDEAIA